MKKILFCFGTRPEAIKLAPLILEAEKFGFSPLVCLSGQHMEMVEPFIDFFNIKVHWNLELMKKGQGLYNITTKTLEGLESILRDQKPNYVFVQGDTSTAFSSALSAFYAQIPVCHVEAGLRTGNKLSPFPEEMNRRLISPLADYHYAPTEQSIANLKNEGISKNVFLTGNTSIDALRITLERFEEFSNKMESQFSSIDFNKKILLVTCHRRENLGAKQEEIFQSLLEIVENNKDVEIVFPVHLNPLIKEISQKILGNQKRIHLIPPLNYQCFIWMIKKSYLILTDSGGVQEEAPYLGKPVLVLRDNTERMEGVDAGTSILVGTKKEEIFKVTQELLSDSNKYSRFNNIKNPYGDGYSAKKILSTLV